jgi:hypothetical protein
LLQYIRLTCLPSNIRRQRVDPNSATPINVFMNHDQPYSTDSVTVKLPITSLFLLARVK